MKQSDMRAEWCIEQLASGMTMLLLLLFSPGY
jgi:hypothetical protein